GLECFRELNGIFAIALFDQTNSTLVLARDHLGVKPLYYYHYGKHFAFASEIKAILESGAYSPDMNWQAFYDYLTLLYVPCPQTMFRGIRQLPPAHVLELSLRTGQLRTFQFWSPVPESEPHSTPSTYGEMKEGLKRLLSDSVTRQMVSDVPLGVMLSGGIDS